MLFKVQILILFLTPMLVIPDTNKSCINNFQDFEQRAIMSNKENRYRIRQAFIQSEALLHVCSSLSVKFISKETNQWISTDPKCDTQYWMWINSPVFYLIAPNELDNYALGMLGFFRHCPHPLIELAIPTPCPDRAEDFLSLMVSQVNLYLYIYLYTDNNIMHIPFDITLS